MAAHTAQQKEGNVTAFWANISDGPFLGPIRNEALPRALRFLTAQRSPPAATLSVRPLHMGFPHVVKVRLQREWKRGRS